MTASVVPAATTAAGATHVREDPAVAWDEQLERQDACAARPGGHRWQMEISEGELLVSCVDCKDHPTPDYTDMLVMKPIPVRLDWVDPHPHPEGHREPTACECDWWLKVTPAPEGPAA